MDRPDALRLDHIIYFVHDLKRAKDFYTKQLGLEVIGDYPDFVQIGAGNGWIGLHPTEVEGRDIGFGPMAYLSTSDLDGLLRHLSAAGVQVRVAATRVPTGRIATIIDSEGNPIGLYERDTKK